MASNRAVSLLIFLAASYAVGQEPVQRIHVDSVRMNELRVKNVAPVYPELARKSRIQATVVLRAEIGKSGKVENLQLISGHPMLAPAAIGAVKQWEYQPYLLNGEAVEVETEVSVNFTLAENSPAQGVVGDMPGGNPDAGGLAPRDLGREIAPGVPQRVRVSQGVMASLVLQKVPPVYPQDAKDQRIQGMVLMRVMIDKQGAISNIQLISGHPLLAPAAIDAVKQWQYRPYLLNGNPVEVETQVQVIFTLMH